MPPDRRRRRPGPRAPVDPRRAGGRRAAARSSPRRSSRRCCARSARISALSPRPSASVCWRSAPAPSRSATSWPAGPWWSRCRSPSRLDRNARVAAALLAGPAPDLARVLHHTVEAGDDAAVVRHGPTVGLRGVPGGGAPAGRRRVRAGAGPLLPARPRRARCAARRPRLVSLQHQPPARRRGGGRRRRRARGTARGPGAGPLPRHPLAAAVAAAAHSGRAGQRPPRGRPRPRRGPPPGRPSQPRRGTGARRPRGGGASPPRPRRCRPGARGAGPQLPRLGPAAAGRPRRAHRAARQRGGRSRTGAARVRDARVLQPRGGPLAARTPRGGGPVPRRGGRVRPRPRLPGPQLLRHGPAAAVAADARGVGAGRAGAAQLARPAPRSRHARPRDRAGAGAAARPSGR